MKVLFTSLLGTLVLAAFAPAALCSPAADDSAKQAMRVLDEFMMAFNARDEAAWMATLHFPHVRIANGVSQWTATPADMMAEFDFEQFAERFDWHHSAWLSREVVQSGPDKVHVVVRFARYRADGSLSAEFDSLYIVARREGRWAVAGRSSFAP